MTTGSEPIASIEPVGTGPMASPAPVASPRVAPRVLELGAAHLAAWALVAAADAAVLVATPSRPVPPIAVRAWHHVYDAGQLLAIGLLSAAAVEAWARWGPRARWAGYAAANAVALVVGALVLPDDVIGAAEKLGGEEGAAYASVGLVAAIALVVPVASLVGRLFARPWVRAAAPVLLVAAAVLNHRVLPKSYPGGHLYAMWAAAAFAASAMAGATWPAWPAGAAGRWGARALRACAALIAAFSCVVPPSNAVLFELVRRPGAIAAPYLAEAQRAIGDDGAIADVIPPKSREWFTSRRSAPAVPPSAPRLLPKDGIVLLLSVDALRADLLTGRARENKLPNLRRLRDESVWFTAARSPGSQTVYALSTLFSGTYFSQQYWSKKKGALWPHQDDTVRFPEVLRDAGVATVTFAGAVWLVNEFGVVRGFGEQRVISVPGSKYAPAEALMDAIVERLAAHGEGPLFLFAHFLDPHAPYDRAGTRGSAFQRYLGEVALVDAQIGRLREAIEQQGKADRTTLVITSDHGEAFGEHGTTTHATTLYDELLRVPLLIRTPGVKPRRVERPVSLVDLGPTVLDLFGAPTPGTFMGQSLVGFLRGRDPELTRPIVAEGRLKRAMVLPDRTKVIVDERSHVVELYDLARDPDETKNVFDASDERDRNRLGTIRAFFEAHTIRRPGYRVPYRP